MTDRKQLTAIDICCLIGQIFCICGMTFQLLDYFVVGNIATVVDAFVYFDSAAQSSALMDGPFELLERTICFGLHVYLLVLSLIPRWICGEAGIDWPVMRLLPGQGSAPEGDLSGEYVILGHVLLAVLWVMLMYWAAFRVCELIKKMRRKEKMTSGAAVMLVVIVLVAARGFVGIVYEFIVPKMLLDLDSFSRAFNFCVFVVLLLLAGVALFCPERIPGLKKKLNKLVD